MVRCCDAWMAERIYWWIERRLALWVSFSLDRCIYIYLSLSFSVSHSLPLSPSLTPFLYNMFCATVSQKSALENFGLLLVQFPVWWCLWTITSFIGSSRAAKGKALQLPKTMVLKHIQHLRCRCLIIQVPRNKVQMQQASFQKWGFARAKYQDLRCLLFLIHLAARQDHLYLAKVKQTKTTPFIFRSFQFLRLILCFYRLICWTRPRSRAAMLLESDIRLDSCLDSWHSAWNWPRLLTFSLELQVLSTQLCHRGCGGSVCAVWAGKKRHTR